MTLLKVVIFAAILHTITYQSYAQKLFVQPYIGVGTTGVISGQPSINTTQNNTSVTGGINLGKSFGRLHINTGVAFLTRGFKWDNLVFESMYNPATGMAYDTATVDITITHKHLLVPLTAGFTVLKGEKFSITPRAGVDLSFNLGSQSKWEYAADGRVTKNKVNGPGNPYPTFSVLGHVSVMFAYHLNNHIAITAEPVFYHPILPMRAGYDNRNYAATGNLGVMFKL